MGLGLVEIAGRESSLLTPRAFARHIYDARRASPVQIEYIGVSESRLTDLALSSPSGMLGVTAGSRFHVCRRDRSGDFRTESCHYRNDCRLTACEWYATDGAVAVLADVSGHVRVLDVAALTTVLNMNFGTATSCSHMSMSPIDHTLFIACLNGLEGCRLIDIRSGSHSQILGVNRSGNDSSRAATCSAWSKSDLYQCVVGRCNQTITVFDIRRPKPLYEISSVWLDCHQSISDLQFTPCGSNIFAASTDGRMIGWRVDGEDGLCHPTRSHAFSAPTSNRAAHSKFAISSNSVYFPNNFSVTIFDLYGKPGVLPTDMVISVGDITTLLYDESEQVLYSCDDNGVIGVVTPRATNVVTDDDNPFIEWESGSDDSNVEFPLLSHSQF